MSPLASVGTLLVVAVTVHAAVAASRSVNISSMWFLPQEGFPVFYRYFKDRITWFEADAVCQFHHANLVTVDTSVQYDATRAYLKELDIATNVWIGLKRPSSAETFAWTDYKKLDPNGGYWQEQIPKTKTPLCAATDPAADFRWHTLNCGGPEVASFICELPVPPWARKEDGCLLTSLPSLTVIYLPEQGAVELASDCGLDGTRRIACKGQANRDEMMRQLSCDHETTSSTDDSSSSGSTTPEVTISSVSGTSDSRAGTTGTSVSGTSASRSGTTGSSVSATSASRAGTTGTGHSHEPPTRHRRDTDPLTQTVTAAVSRVTRPDETESATTTTLGDDATSTVVEAVTTDKQTTNQEPQLSTTSDITYTMTEEVTDSSTSQSASTINLEEGFIQVRELEVIAENNTEKAIEVDLTSNPTTVAQSVTSEPPANATQLTTTPTLPAEGTTVKSTPPSEAPTGRNATENTSDYTISTTDTTTTSKPSTNNTETMDFISAIREEMANFSVLPNGPKSDEIKSREEAEEERLKEEERREEERKFKEEEENRRRQFLPAPLRSLPTEAKTSRPPAAVEEYEEPEEVMEPEPEAPVRPNRGRRLTRPQPHSFYPYFLNRVLG